MQAERKFDLICLGRAAVDLYGEQIGGRLEDMLNFAKYLGGSPANTAVGCARLGLRPAMLTRVGDEHNGRFVRETLAAEGVDVSRVLTDPKRLTALVFLGIHDRASFPLIFYRENCADMAISVDDFDAAYIGQAKGLLLSGTHLSQAGSYAACRKAMELARATGTRVVLDIDYRPVLWGLTGHGAGEERFIASGEVSAHLQTVVSGCDLIVGTEEEMHIAGGSTSTLAALQRLRELTAATLVVKRGPMGCMVFEGEIPKHIEDGIAGTGFAVEVYNILGAGDAFMAGFLRGWLRDEPLTQCCAYANACGALVVSRHGCAPAIPSWIELRHFLDHGSAHHRLREDARLNQLHRATTRTRRWKPLAVLAFDHRVQFEELASSYAAPPARIGRFKHLVAQGATAAATKAKNGDDAMDHGIILDSGYGEAIFPSMTGTGWWVARPVELPGSRPLEFEAGNNIALTLRTWPGEHVAKCLVSYHPDDEPSMRAAQLTRLVDLYQACGETFHELLIEIIPPQRADDDAKVTARAMEQIYAAGVFPDWWKLPPSDQVASWSEVSAVIARNDPHCRGVLLLGLEASEDVLARSFRAAAAHPVCRGFAVGRSIFADAAQDWFAGRIGDADVVADVAQRYARLIALWHEAQSANTMDYLNLKKEKTA